MVAKKPEQIKYEHITFSVSPELKSKVKGKVSSDGVTLSGVISSLLTMWVDGEVLHPDREPPSPIVSDDRERLLKLEAMVSELMRNNTDRYVSVKPVTQLEEIPEAPAEIITPEEVTGFVHQGDEPGLTLNSQGAYEITSEVREHIIRHLDTLHVAGMIDSHIAREAGFNKSLITLIRDGHQKSIKPDKYRALMAIKPIAP